MDYASLIPTRLQALCFRFWKRLHCFKARDNVRFITVHFGWLRLWLLKILLYQGQKANNWHAFALQQGPRHTTRNMIVVSSLRFNPFPSCTPETYYLGSIIIS